MVTFKTRPTIIEINKQSLLNNIQSISKFLHKKTKICAIVKSNSYGHGLLEVSKTIFRLPQIKFLGITGIEEGILLRENNIAKPILLLGSIYPFENIKEIIHYDITPTVASIDVLKELEKYATKFSKKIKFHLKIDTGMGRIGILPWRMEKFIEEYTNTKGVICEGVYTHFSSAKEDKEYTEYQLKIFNEMLKKIHTAGIKPQFVHVANSAGLILYKNSHFNLVRPGLLLYGLLPIPETKNIINVKPVLSLKSKIVFLKTLPKGCYISYGKTYQTKKLTKVATVPLGYADGLLRKLSNRGKTIVKGEYCDIIGRVTMDMVMIDVTKVKNVNVGDEVVFIGSQADKCITVEQVAEWSETINYEIVTILSTRIPRVLV